MKKVTLDKHNIAIGLYWASLAGEKPSAELAVMASEVNRTFGFTRKLLKEDGSSSFQVALTDDKSLVGSISGAAVIAEKYPDIIFVEKISSQEVWICAVVDSEILVGSDVLVNVENAVAEFNKIYSNYKENPVFAYGKSLSDVIDVEELPEADQICSFGELLAIAEVTKLGRQFNAFKIASVESNSKNIIMGLVAIGLLGGVGYTQFGDLIFPKEEEFKTAIINVPEIIKSNKESEEDILARAKDEEIKWIRNDFNSSNPSSVIRRMLAFDIVQDKYINGWSAIGITYDSKNPTDINLQWKSLSFGTPLSLRKGINNSKEIVPDLDGKSATVTYDAIDKIDNGYESDFDIVSYIENTPYKHESMMHDLTSMGYVWSMATHDFGERPFKIKGLEKKSRKSETERQLVLKAVNVTIQGDNRDKLSALIKIMEISKTFKLNKVTISLENNSFQWTVQGVLYEK